MIPSYPFNGLESIHYSERDPGLAWIKDPQIAIDLDTPLDSQSILTPNVVSLPTGGFRMYYTGLGPARTVADCFGYILSATSEDGLTWSKDSDIRMDVHEPDAMCRVLCPDVIPLPDGRWRMYYEARVKDHPTTILSAVSEDGLAWRREPGVRAADPQWSFGTPRCLYFESPDNRGQLIFRLYFHHYSFPLKTGLDKQNHIISAISENGLRFEIEPGVRVAQESAERESLAVYAPEVIRLGDGSYRMYYSGWGENIDGGIFSATSADGLNWTKDPGPLLDLDRPLDSRMVSEPCVIDLDDGRFRMFYEAEDTDQNCRILSATSE
jgi:hypothetical protein